MFTSDQERLNLHRDQTGNPSPVRQTVSKTSWRLALSGLSPGHHLLQVYRDPSAVEEAVSFFIRDGLSKGEAVLVVARESRCENLVRRLKEDRSAPGGLLNTNQPVFKHADALLNEFMNDSRPDWALFKEKIGGAIQRARGKNSKIRIYGEMVDILSEAGNKAAALRLEEMWNALASHYPFSLFCAYSEDNIHSDDGSFVHDVCARHTDQIQV